MARSNFHQLWDAAHKACSSKPLTHDFICSIISNLGAALKYVIVDKLIDETFYAKAFLEREGTSIVIDCRPSDAFATAIRANAPIFVSEGVLRKAGISSNQIERIIDNRGEE